MGRRAVGPRRMQPPQARQIGAVRPFRGHRPARAGARRRTAVPGHGPRRAASGVQLRQCHRPARRPLRTAGASHRLPRHDRRQPAPEHRLRTPSAGGAACRRHRARPAKRQPLCGTRADLGEVRGHAASGADGDLPPPAGGQRTCGRTGQHRRQEGRQGFGRRFGKRNGNQFGERNGNQFGERNGNQFGK